MLNLNFRPLRRGSRASDATRLVFDHVPKTGGSAASEAFSAALPAATVSPHLHPYDRDEADEDFTKWRHLVGHFGWAHRHRIPHFGTALTATIVREPIATVVSTYTFWRFNVERERASYVALAHDLSFGEFIRAFDPESDFLNRQSTFLGGNVEGDPGAFARAALAPYRIVGTTNDLESFVRRTLARIAPRQARRSRELLAAAPRNASLGSIEPTCDDLDYLAEHQAFDRALYAEARRRSEEEP